MFSKEVTLMLLISRRDLLMQRNPVENAKIVRKIDRKIRMLSSED